MHADGYKTDIINDNFGKLCVDFASPFTLCGSLGGLPSIAAINTLASVNVDAGDINAGEVRGHDGSGTGEVR